MFTLNFRREGSWMGGKQEQEGEPQWTEREIGKDNKLQISEDPKRLRHHSRKLFQHRLPSKFSESLCYVISQSSDLQGKRKNSLQQYRQG